MDDILVYSRSLSEHIRDVETVLQILMKHKLFIKLKKCEMFSESVTFLGHKLSAEGISVEESKVKAIREWPTPMNVKQIQSFIGCCSYYRRFIQDFAKRAEPLTRLTRKELEWEWKKEQQEAFNDLKEALSSTPVLMAPNYEQEFNITSDASGTGIGGVLTQLDVNKKERPIAYFSRQLKGHERNWSTYELETLALVESLKNFRHYVEGSKINLFTDHKALIYLNNQPKLNAKQARWISFINLFDYSIKYKEGALNKVADGLSRQFSKDSLEEKKPERLRIDCNLNYVEEETPLQLARARLRIQTLCANEVCSMESTLIDEIKKAQQLDD